MWTRVGSSLVGTSLIGTPAVAHGSLTGIPLEARVSAYGQAGNRATDALARGPASRNHRRRAEKPVSHEFHGACESGRAVVACPGN